MNRSLRLYIANEKLKYQIRSVAKIRVINIRRDRFAPDPRQLKKLAREFKGSNRFGPALIPILVSRD